MIIKILFLIMIFFLLIYPVARWIAKIMAVAKVHDWVAIEMIVVDARVVERQKKKWVFFGGKVSLYFHAQFRVLEKRYGAKTISVFGSGGLTARKVLSGIEPGSSVMGFMDPQNPENNVLVHPASLGNGGLVVKTLFFWALAATLIYWMAT